MVTPNVGNSGLGHVKPRCAEDLNLKSVKPLGGHFRRGVF